MKKSLLISVYFHDGWYHGEEDQFSHGKGWPPSPGRLFQALVSGAARGDTISPEDQKALKWLENVAPPKIIAPAASYSAVVARSVPTNDRDVEKNLARHEKNRIMKFWQSCTFDSTKPVNYIWDFDVKQADKTLSHAERMCIIAKRLYQLGRGIDAAWAVGRIFDTEIDTKLQEFSGVFWAPKGSGGVPCPCSGTLESLVKKYEQTRMSINMANGKSIVRQPDTRPLFHRVGYNTPSQYLCFELRDDDNYFPHPVYSVATLITSIRNAAVEKLQKCWAENSALFERIIVGRGASAGDLARRIKIIPIPSIGATHADFAIRRIVVVIPPECPISRNDLEWAFTGIELSDSEIVGAGRWHLIPAIDQRMVQRFDRQADTFQSITAVALSASFRKVAAKRLSGVDVRVYPHARVRAASAIIQTLRHAGIAIRPTAVRVQREPFQQKGAHARLFSTGSRFARHELWHAEIQFPNAVGGGGPLVIGDGRFYGLGLMLPITKFSDIFVFNIKLKNSLSASDQFVLVKSLRRALMARARDNDGMVCRLFSGHESGGEPDRVGNHAHIFIAIDRGVYDDPKTARLVVMAPWMVDRNMKSSKENRDLFEKVVLSFRQLRTRGLGSYKELTAQMIEEGDPLIGPAQIWISKTSYTATRNKKKKENLIAVVKDDVMRECFRRGLPRPSQVEVLDASVGPRGGKPAAKLKISFSSAISGPVLLGRDSHMGGGLFHSLAAESG